MIEFKSVDFPGLDMIEVENLRKWLEYNPKCYSEKLKSNKLDKQKLKEDEITLLRIKKLYFLISKIDEELNLTERHFNLKNPHSSEEEQEYQKLISSIPSLNISYYASIKLTDEERQFAYDFMKKCNKDNSAEMREYAENYPNFFVGSYMVELLIHHPESDYAYSTKNVGTTVKKSTRRLTKKMQQISRKEKENIEYARHSPRR